MGKEKKTLILGATTNPERYAYLAAESLQKYGIDFIPVGVKKGEVFGKQIVNDKKIIEGVHTVTLYIGAEKQTEWYDYILELNPKRIIFNPGTENTTFQKLAKAKGIEVVVACTLVMISVREY